MKRVICITIQQYPNDIGKREQDENMSQFNDQQSEQTPDPQVDSHQGKKGTKVAPLWVATIVALLIGIIYVILPKRITLGPGWLPLAIEIIVILPSIIAHLIKHPAAPHINRISAFIVLGIVTIALSIAVILLVATLPQRQGGHQAINLLRTGVSLYISNILVFSLWYWEIDGNGPHKRFQAGHKASDLLFPQQADGNSKGWVPYFVDYLFVAFTASTALSPTDTFPLTHRAKLLMTIQALIAMTILSILIGRAINIRHASVREEAEAPQKR
jgi:hypothetical protein